ncbi:MAG: class I SAM-dependent methyltransferase [Christensenella sp.]|nr:class I SAM-dependent methyltransferase [Christensenella sp.]
MTRQYQEFASYYDTLMTDVDYAMWADYLKRLLQSGGVLPGEPILDCACGTGEITLRLHQAGYIMTGADCSERMLERAQQKARRAGAKIAFVQQELQQINVHKPVSAITCVCDGVNYLLTKKDISAFFAGANRALKDGGLLLFDISSAYKLEHVLGGQTFGENERDYTYLWQNCFDPISKLLEMRLSFFVPDESSKYTRFDERHVQSAHTQEALTTALEHAGFTVSGVYEAFTLDSPKKESERIQFIAQKKRGIESSLKE